MSGDDAEDEDLLLILLPVELPITSFKALSSLAEDFVEADDDLIVEPTPEDFADEAEEVILELTADDFSPELTDEFMPDFEFDTFDATFDVVDGTPSTEKVSLENRLTQMIELTRCNARIKLRGDIRLV